MHHDIWDYDAASPVVLFDTVINGQPRKGIAEAGRTGWVYILDRTNGKPLIGIEEKPGAAGAAAEDREDPALSGRRRDRAAMRRAAARIRQGRLHLRAFWDEPGPDPALRASAAPTGRRCRTARTPAIFYVPGTVRTSAFARYGATEYKTGQRYTGGTQAAPIGSAMSGTFTAIDGHTNKIAWQQKTPYRIGGGGGSTATAGGLVFRGEPDGNFLALDAKTGEELWRFQTGFGAEAPPVVYEVDGEQYIAIATGGNQVNGSANGDAVWTFSLKGTVRPALAAAPPPTAAGPVGPIADRVGTVKIGDNNVEYAYWPARNRVKAGAAVTFTNVGDIPHTATSIRNGEWDTGMLAKGESKMVTFDKAGNYYYICTPHPWMYGQIIVEK